MTEHREFVADSFPAEVHIPHKLSAHSPVSTDLPFAREEMQRPVRPLDISNISPEEWGNGNQLVQMSTKNKFVEIAREFEPEDVSSLHRRTISLAGAVLTDKFTQKRRKGPKPGPFGEFCAQNKKRPKLRQLKFAHEVGDYVTFQGLSKRITSDSWSAFLRKMRSSDATKLFRQLAQLDG